MFIEYSEDFRNMINITFNLNEEDNEMCIGLTYLLELNNNFDEALITFEQIKKIIMNDLEKN